MQHDDLVTIAVADIETADFQCIGQMQLLKNRVDDFTAAAFKCIEQMQLLDIMKDPARPSRGKM
jgi:hypothetical protein